MRLRKQLRPSVLNRVASHLVTPLGAQQSSFAAANPLLSALDDTQRRYIPNTNTHIVSHCKVPLEKAVEFWTLAEELIPNCRVEPYQVRTRASSLP